MVEIFILVKNTGINPKNSYFDWNTFVENCYKAKPSLKLYWNRFSKNSKKFEHVEKWNKKLLFKRFYSPRLVIYLSIWPLFCTYT